MNTVKNFAKGEPVITAAVLAALTAALINVLVQFGVPLTEGQVDAVQGLVIVVAPLAVALARKHVSPSAGVIPKRDVLEYSQDGHVLAGEANELPTNTHIREVGDLDAGV